MRQAQKPITSGHFPGLEGAAHAAAVGHAAGVAEGAAIALEKLLARPKVHAAAIAELSKLLADCEDVLRVPVRTRMH